MIAAFATLAFLATLWLVTFLAAQTLAQTGGRIGAALKGASGLPVTAFHAPVPIRSNARPFRQQASMRVKPKLRAAA